MNKHLPARWKVDRAVPIFKDTFVCLPSFSLPMLIQQNQRVVPPKTASNLARCQKVTLFFFLSAVLYAYFNKSSFNATMLR